LSARIPQNIVIAIKKEYLEKDLSLREICLKYQVSETAIQKRAVRESWIIDKNKVNEVVVSNVQSLYERKEELLEKHASFVRERMQKYYAKIDETKERIAGPIVPSDLNCIIGAEAKVDMVIRRSLGAEEKLDITTKGRSISEDIIETLRKVRAMPKEKEGRLIDVSFLKEASKNLTE